MTTPSTSPASQAPTPNADPTGIRGRFVWYDLMTRDAQGAVAFYGDVAGWGTQAWQNPEMPYTMWMAGEDMIGGIGPLPEDAPAPPHWLAYVAVPDVDASAAQARELGGQVIHPPMDIPEVGRFAIIADPQGAMIALFSSAQGPMPEPEPRPGLISWHELATSDDEAAMEFYSRLFGWETIDNMDMGPLGFYRIYGQRGKQYGGMYKKPADMPVPPHWLLYIQVADLDATVEKVKARGGQLLFGPEEVPGGGRIAQCLDPQGAMFALHTPGAQS